MAIFYTRDQIAHMSAELTIEKLNGMKVGIVLRGKEYRATIQADNNGTAVAVLDKPNAYYDMSKVEIASHKFNNYTDHNLGGVFTKQV